jgi:hypothetical protein
MKHNVKFCLIVIAACIFLAATPARCAIKLDARTTLFVDPAAPAAVQRAALDLASDWNKVFGQPIRVVNDPKKAGATTVWVTLDGSAPQSLQAPSGWEQLSIQAIGNPWPGSPARQAIVLTGSDTRGAIYAIYEFSQKFLGVDPLYWWTDHAPARRTSVEIPDDFVETQAPVFHYRGFFVNDEDLLTGWQPGLSDNTGISLALWDHVFEAILRLKGDMVIPGTWIFPYEPQVAAAVARGLVVTQNHTNVLGLDTYRWPSDKSYSFSDDPVSTINAWKKSIQEYPKGAEVVWSVGYRGLNDYPFWQVDKNAPTSDAGRAAVIRAAIDKEIETLHEFHPQAPVVMNAWQESSGFIHDGFLKIPDGVSLVWPDNGHGLIQDNGALAAGEGVYYHTAMYDFRSNHFTEMIPLERIQRELGRAASAGATEYFLVNTSNFRPVVMTTRAVMELAWNPKPWIDARSDESSAYLKKWSAEEFGAKAAPAVEKYYDAYFKAPAKYATGEDAVLGDNFDQTLSQLLLVALIEGNAGEFRVGPGDRFRDLAEMSAYLLGSDHQFQNVADLAAFLRPICQEADGRWQSAQAMANAARPSIPAGRAQFFQANVLTQVGVRMHGNRMVLDLAEAAGSTTDAERVARVEAAIGEGQALMTALRAADYGKWRGFYTDGDWLVDVPLTLEITQAYLDQIKGVRVVPENLLIRVEDGGFGYHMITAYQGTQQVQF